LIAISVSAALAAAIAGHLGAASPGFFLAVAAYGGLSLTTYALCLAHVNDHLQPAQMVAASATVLLANGIGSALGPVAVSAAMQLAGPGAFFVCMIVLHGTFALYAGWRKRKSDPVPAPDKTPFVSAPPQVAPTGRLGAPEARAADPTAGMPRLDTRP
jgi:hypothetical protein